MRRRRLIVLIGGAALLPLMARAQEQVVPASPPPTKARLYIYRDTSTYGSQAWTAVSLNHMKIGDSAPGTVFYRDVAPGTYEVEVRSDKLYPDQFKTVQLAAGSITFAKIEDQPAWDKSGFGRLGTTFVVVIVDDPAIASAQMSGLRLIPG